jgi:multimeric flavodoxin WrbA
MPATPASESIGGHARLRNAGSGVMLRDTVPAHAPSASASKLSASTTIASVKQQKSLVGPESRTSADLMDDCRPKRLRRRVVALALACCFIAIDLARGGEAPGPATSAEKRAVRVLVAYYSRTGNTEQMARGVAEGVKRVPGAAPVLKKVGEVSQADLEAADGIILGCPTYFANIPGEMKAIIDDWNWKWKVDFTDKVGGAFATAGGQVGGQEHVVVSLLLFMLHNRMIVAGPLYRNDKTGSVWAEAGAAAITGPLDPGVGEGELDGGRRLGERVALLAKKLKSSPAPGSVAEETGSIALFDGKTLAGWTVKCLPKDRELAAKAWTVDQGTILANTLGHREHFYIMLVTQKEYGEFVLRLRVQVERDVTGNSGIQIRSRYNEETGWMEGPQIDINPPGMELTGKLWNEGPGPHRWLSNETIPGQKSYYADEGDGWNDMEITAQGTRIKSALNGVTLVDFDGAGVLDDESHRKVNVGLRGLIGLQIHSGHELKLRFKDIRIKPL